MNEMEGGRKEGMRVSDGFKQRNGRKEGRKEGMEGRRE
jgi:hypothetical protein